MTPARRAIKERRPDSDAKPTGGDVNVGGVLQQLRMERGLSLRVLADRTGFSASFLSQVERNQVSPSIGSLQKIAQALSVTVAKFFAATETANLIIRSAERQSIRSNWSKGHIGMLQDSSWDFPVEIVLITMDCGGMSSKHPVPQPRTQVALILRGEAALTLDQKVHVMASGDSVLIKKGVAHRWENRSEEEVEILVATTHFR
jgi:transcriptional regulator with XRE-family HTH domain